MTFGYKTITEYRVLPPRVRIIYPEVSDPGERCVAEADELLRPKTETDAGDIAALVLGAQATERSASSKNLSRLISERITLADRHAKEIKWRLDDLRTRIPQLGYGVASDGSLSDTERQALDLEKQKREVQSKLWNDVVQLKRDLFTERSEYQGTMRRFSFLSGGSYGTAK